MRVIKILDPAGVAGSKGEDYKLRRAARAVVSDADGLVALLHVTKHGYYKLPRGGIEGKEKVLPALRRECLEEIGTDVQVDDELGEVIEYRPKLKVKQISYCFTAHTIGGKGEPDFDEGEKEKGFRPVWVEPGKALSLVRSSKPTGDLIGSFVIDRDSLLLETALQRL